MAEQRTKLGHILLKFLTTTKLEIFDALQWKLPGADAGTYRVRKGDIYSGSWLQPQAGEGEAMFFTAEGLARLLARELTQPGALDALEFGKPNIVKGQYVRVWPDPTSGRKTWGCTRTRAASDPIRCYDGQWRILIAGMDLVDCALVQPLDHLGREVLP